MKRRDVITGIGGAAAMWPLVARAQQPQKMHRIALVHTGIPASRMTETGGTFWIRKFHEELRLLGFKEGANLVIERFSAEGDTSRFAVLASDVVSRKPDVIISNGSPLVKALMVAGPMIPVVGLMGDPIAGGLASNLARPGGNLTGVSIDGGPGIPAKRLQILKEAVPTARNIEFMVSSKVEAQRSSLPVAYRLLTDVNEANLRRAFAEMAEHKVDALIMSENGSYVAMRGMLAGLASQHRIPIIYAYREFAEAGGLISYGPELGELAKQLAHDVFQILNGANPGEIPIQQPKKYELLVNLKTALTLGLPIPAALLAQADEVIE